jgi:hypothetical protein
MATRKQAIALWNATLDLGRSTGYDDDCGLRAEMVEVVEASAAAGRNRQAEAIYVCMGQINCMLSTHLHSGGASVTGNWDHTPAIDFAAQYIPRNEAEDYFYHARK